VICEPRRKIMLEQFFLERKRRRKTAVQKQILRIVIIKYIGTYFRDLSLIITSVIIYDSYY